MNVNYAWLSLPLVSLVVDENVVELKLIQSLVEQWSWIAHGVKSYLNIASAASLNCVLQVYYFLSLPFHFSVVTVKFYDLFNVV